MKPHATLDELRDALTRGVLAEAEIRDDENHVSGLCREDGLIVINPAPGIVEVLLHELIHKCHWRWGEARVQREAGRLLGQMSDRDVREFYAAYRRKRRKQRAPVRIEKSQVA